jgi:hypothetical protein
MPTSTISTSTTLKASAGIVRTVNVCIAGSADGTINDAASVGAAASSNAVLGTSSSHGSTGNSFVNPIKCANGITVVPGTGQTIWIDWE